MAASYKFDSLARISDTYWMLFNMVTVVIIGNAISFILLSFIIVEIKGNDFHNLDYENHQKATNRSEIIDGGDFGNQPLNGSDSLKDLMETIDDQQNTSLSVVDHKIASSNDVGDIGNKSLTSAESNVAKSQGSVLPLQVHEGSISQETYNQLIEMAENARYPLLVVGGICSAVNVAVYARKTMRNPLSMYLIAVNVTDLLYVVCGLINRIAVSVYGSTKFTSLGYLIIGLYISNYVSVAIQRSTYCFTCLISLERFMALTFPLKRRNSRLIKSPILFIIGTIMISFICHSYGIFKYTLTSYKSPTNETLWKFGYTSIKNELESWSFASKIIFIYLQLFGCLFLNTAIVLALKYHSHMRKRLTGSVIDDKMSIKERQTTITILVSTFVFVILALPIATNSIVANLKDDYGIYTREHFLFYFIQRVGTLCQLLSNCTNFISYLTLSTQFRNTFFGMFRRKKPALTRFGHESTKLSTLS